MKIQIHFFTLIVLILLQVNTIAQQVQTFPVTAASFPKEVIPVEGGKIQITAKFNDLAGVILYDEPVLFWITDGISTYKLGFNGFKGLVGEVGDAFYVRTNGEEEIFYYDLLTYKDLFPDFDINEWHVFTLQWDKNGIPGIDNGTRKVAIYIDGINRSKIWDEPAGNLNFPPLTSGVFNLLAKEMEGESKPFVSIRDLVIYDRHNNVILKNSLGSTRAIKNSIIGANGQFNGGGNAHFLNFDEYISPGLTAYPVFSISLPSTPLVLSCETKIKKQHNKANYYHIPELKTSGLFSNVDFTITGSTNGNGYGLDATGYFNPGISYINWNAIDRDGNFNTCQTQIEISEPSDQDPAWTYYAPIIKDSGINNGTLIQAGDLNGDGYKDIVAYYDRGWLPYNIPGYGRAYDRRFGVARTFNGGPTGLDPVPVSDILEGFFGTGDYIPDFTLNSAGDVNGDGFNDLVGGNNFGHLSYLYSGSRNGLDSNFDWEWDDYYLEKSGEDLGYSILGKYAGDLNSDGFADVVFTGDQSPNSLVFYGSPTGLKSTFSWKFSLLQNLPSEGLALGDINNDGFDDLAILYPDKFLALFMGSLSGLNSVPVLVQKFPNGYQTKITAGGDINGDHFYDLLISGYSALDSSSYILYGTASGLDTAGVKIPYMKNPNFIGDINKDGFDEVVGNGLIYYGSSKGFYPIPDALVQHMTEQVGAAGDVNNDGFGDILGRTMQEMQLYYGFADSKPYKERIELCGTLNRLYTLPQLYVNLPGSIVKFTITGTTKRSGSGKDASGNFKNGTSYLTWKVTDQFGKLYSFTATIIVNPYLDVQIVDAYAVQPSGDPNTIYLGYGKQNLILKSKIAGGSHKYSYKWSTGSTASSISISPAREGIYWYKLWVTDGSNCMSADSVKVTVVDVRCEQKISIILDKYLPGWSNWKILQDFIRDRNFVKVCIPLKGKWISTCVPSNNVASIIAQGGKLGVCKPNNQMIVQSEFPKDLKVAGKFSARVSPNPSVIGFNLEVDGNISEPLNIVIRDPLGSSVEMIRCAYSSRLVIGSRLKKGVYFVEVIQGKQRKVIRIVKL